MIEAMTRIVGYATGSTRGRPLGAILARGMGMPESIIDADAKDVMWAIDFQFDATVDGHTRESLHSARRALVQRVHR